MVTGQGSEETTGTVNSVEIIATEMFHKEMNKQQGQ